MSRSTVRRSPDLSAPMLITMSISGAPSKIARRVSYCLTSAVVAPSGKPTTEQTPTPVPRSSDAASRDPGRVHAHRREAELGRLAAQLLDLGARRVRLEQRVIDHRRRRRRARRRSRAGRAGVAPASSTPRSRSGSSRRRPHDRRSALEAGQGAWRRDHLLGDDLDQPLEILWVQHACHSRPARSSSRRIFTSRRM